MKILSLVLALFFAFAGFVFAQDNNSQGSAGNKDSAGIEEFTEDVRDPFASSMFEETPAVVADKPAEVPAGDFVLQGLAIGSDKSGAVINGKFYRPGDKKDGIEVVAVRKKEADVMVQGVLLKLALGTKNIKKD